MRIVRSLACSAFPMTQPSSPLIQIAVAVALLFVSPVVRGETHRFSPTEYHNTFSAGHRPVLTLKPGDRLITKTIDASGLDSQEQQVGRRPNPQTGPFFVDGAEPGDILVVHLEKIECNRATAWSGSLLAPYAVDPGFLRSEALREQRNQTWAIDKKNGIAYIESASFRPGRIEIPLKPMLGCVATAPPRKQAIVTSTPDTFGGNMDYNGMVAGVKLMLPVFEPGALLFLGDGHAAQGDGELIGNALETSMDVELTVELIKHKRINWPRAESQDFIMVLGSARPLLQALQHATTDMQRWLMEDFGFDEHGSSLLMGHVVQYDIANVVDPHFTVVAKISKSCLAAKAMSK
ncbi:MAG: acetamidase/formamidase family protein [Phycisphaerales bacterium]|nr:MAG: acetamidase/formamidase family protein [Phycisphaerales bacterium]